MGATIAVSETVCGDKETESQDTSWSIFRRSTSHSLPQAAQCMFSLPSFWHEKLIFFCIFMTVYGNSLHFNQGRKLSNITWREGTNVEKLASWAGLKYNMLPAPVAEILVGLLNNVSYMLTELAASHYHLPTMVVALWVQKQVHFRPWLQSYWTVELIDVLYVCHTQSCQPSSLQKHLRPIYEGWVMSQLLFVHFWQLKSSSSI